MDRSVRLAWLALAPLVLATLTGLRCDWPRPPRGEARAVGTMAGSCDGVVDYRDELRVARVDLEWAGPAGLDRFEAQLQVELENETGARFRSAAALPDLSGHPHLEAALGAASLPAEFGPIGPGERATSRNGLVLQMPLEQLVETIQGLRDGTIPMTVHADEETVYAPGVRVMNWTYLNDLHFRSWEGNLSEGGGVEDLDYTRPYMPGDVYKFWMLDSVADPPTGEPLHPGGVGNGGEPFDFDALCAGWDYHGHITEDGQGTCVWRNPDETVYITPGEEPLWGIPESLHFVRVLTLYRELNLTAGAYGVIMRVQRTDADAITDLVQSGSFCSGRGAWIDPPIQATRLLQIDGRETEDDERDGHTQPIRVNDLRFASGALSFSGQIAGHVFQPSLALRVRDGQVTANARFDTDLSFTAELKAEAEEQLDREEHELWSLCFPLPNLSAGPLSVPMSLQIAHDVGIEGRIGAGVRIGFSKHFQSGFSIQCDATPGQPASCASSGHRTPTPIELTPPELTDATGFDVRTDTTLSALLRLGSAYPECETGPGLSVETTAYAEAHVAPTEDPWWSTAYGLEGRAAFELAVLGLEVARHETELFAVEDGAASSADLPASAGFARALAAEPRSSGEDQRWAVAIDDTSVPNGVNTTSIAVLPDGSSLAVATEAVGFRNPIVKLDRHGALVWVKEFSKKVQRVRALPDGTAIAVGHDAWLARIDGDGDLLWSFDAELARQDLASARCTLSDVAPIEVSPGVYDYVAVGRMGAAIVTQIDACALRVNADGTLAWQRIYVGSQGQRFHAVIPIRGGDVVAVGYDDWADPFGSAVPLFARLDPATGDVRWWKQLPMYRSAQLYGVAEAPDGTLFGVGNAQRIVTETHAALVARIAPDGSDPRHALIIQDENWETLLDLGWGAAFDYEPWVDTAGGDTAYDTFFDVAASGDGVVVVGRTGLGDETAAWAAKLTANLGVEWMTTFDGASADSLDTVAVAPDGYLVAGHSTSLPQALGTTGESQLWVMKLPFTGLVDLVPDAAVTSRYVVPGVRASSNDSDISPVVSLDGSFTIEDAVVVSSGANPGILVNASPYCVELLTTTGRPSTLDGCPE